MTSILLIAALLLAAAAGLTALLAPLHVRVDIATAAPPAGHVRTRVRWLFVRWDSRRPRPARRDAGPPEKATGAGPTDASRRKRGHAGGSRRALAVLRTAGFPSRVVRLVRRLLRVARPRRAHVRGRVGLEDPASTGELFGVLYGLAGARSSLGPAWDVRVEPDFVEPVCDLRGTVEWSVSAADVLWPVAAFAASPVTWRALGAAWRA